MGFPGSDVWIRHVAQFIELGQFDPSAKVIKPQTRAEFYEPTDKLLHLLKIDPNEFDKSKDVAILSRSDVLSRGFLPSPHMIIHAAAHGDYWQFYPEDETVLIKCAEFCYLVSNLLENQEIPPNAFSTQTASLRQGDYGDNAIELITAYFLNYRAAQINIPGRQELSLKLDKMAKEAASELKELFKGKIAVVTTVNEIDA